MNKRKYVILGLLLVVAAWVGIELILNSHWFLPSPQVDVRIEVSGTPDTTIEAAFEVDGVVSRVSRLLPTSLSFPMAKKVTFTISREPARGRLVAYGIINDEKGGPWGGPADWVSGRIE